MPGNYQTILPPFLDIFPETFGFTGDIFNIDNFALEASRAG